MNVHDLQKELYNKGFINTAKQLENLIKSEDLIDNIQSIFKECVSPTQTFPDDINLLYKQLSNLTEVKGEYSPIITRNLLTTLIEIIKPTDELSIIYMEDEELEEAISLYQYAVIGNVNAQLELGHLYRNIEHDDWAFPWFEASAKAGNPEALYWLGNYYYMGKVVGKDLGKTYFCYKEAAEKGYPDAMNNYADMYLRGEYVDKNANRALELFMQAAEKEVPEAMYTLGYMYENGVGTKSDLNESRSWYIKSALAGDVFAANKLGHEAVENGLGEEAISWYKMAADHGDSYGEFNLGHCYENGIGTPINLKKAKTWYQKAALKGDKQAKERLRVL
ncbi:tetratricopeptide repeat protein [Paucisalibacillus sp. EB02]|uniref:tetratricopeptide repeat protein n=1 Tax=Paucisalibacillus sp. EB02 TaxID=1347087 RepID=UPI0005A84E67|nr:tetratricopeptide repeat protein [Paucisalibacillus sp. EB02]